MCNNADKIQSDLPVKEILEQENIFVMVIPVRCTGYSSDSDPDSESDAIKGRDRTSAAPISVQYTVAD